MTALKLYGGRYGSSLRCHWALNEAGAEYETVALNMKEGEHKKPEFLAVNPNGQVPAMVDGEFKLFESLAINDYVAEKFMPGLTGSNAEEKALVLQWSIWSGVNLHHNFNKLISYRWTGMKDEKVMAEAKMALDRFMPVLEKALEGKSFLVGERFSLADINVCAILTYNKENDYDMTAYKNVIAWMNALMSRPAFKNATEEKKA